MLYLAGGLIAGGTLACLFMDNGGSDVAVAHKVKPRMMRRSSQYLTAYLSSEQAGSANLLLLYLVKCAFGSWVYQIPVWRRTRVHSMLLAGLGATIVLLAFYQTWLGLIAAGRDTIEWLAPLIVSLITFITGSGQGEVLRATLESS